MAAGQDKLVTHPQYNKQNKIVKTFVEVFRHVINTSY